MAVINKVRDFRIKNGLTQDHIAGVLEFSRGYIGQVESPTTGSKYNLNHLNKLALEFGCTVHDLIPEKPIVENYTKGRKNTAKKARAKKK